MDVDKAASTSTSSFQLPWVRPGYREVALEGVLEAGECAEQLGAGSVHPAAAGVKGGAWGPTN